MKPHQDDPRVVHVLPGSYGLFNRVKSMLQLLAREPESELHVEWQSCMHCPGTFHSVLCDMPGVIVHDTRVNEDENTRRESLKLNRSNDWQQHVHVLQAPEVLTEHTAQMHAACDGNFVAIHVRHTDLDDKHVQQGRPVLNDQDFTRWLDQQIDKQPDTHVYIATDNPHTHEKFARMYDWRVLNPEYHEQLSMQHNKHTRWRDNPKWRKRHTSLPDTMRDWLMCVTARAFRGTGYSTFTGVADVVRAHAKREK